jgi:hypothetical protein
MRYALVRQADGVVANVVELAEQSKWSPPEGHVTIRDAAGTAQIGGRWDGASFLAGQFVPDEGEVLAAALTDRRLLAALVMRAWPEATALEREWSAGVIAAAGQRVRQARG